MQDDATKDATVAVEREIEVLRRRQNTITQTR